MSCIYTVIKVRSSGIWVTWDEVEPMTLCYKTTSLATISVKSSSLIVVNNLLIGYYYISNYYLLIDNVGCSCNHEVVKEGEERKLAFQLRLHGVTYSYIYLYGVTSCAMRADIDLVIVILLGIEPKI